MELKLSRGKVMLVGGALIALVIITISLTIALAARQSCHNHYESNDQVTSEDTSATITSNEPDTDTSVQESEDTSVTVTSKVTEISIQDPITTSTTTLADSKPWEHIRLPSNILPLHYDLLLYPDLQNGSFIGNVTIVVNVIDSTQLFIVHIYKLDIQHVEVYEGSEPDNSNSIPINDSFGFPKNEFYVIQLENTVAAGNYSLHFQFQGSLLGQIVGFYRSSYVDTKTNETRFLATSKFQPTYARRAFPCFDEPTFKSTFTVSLIHPNNYVALSNMNEMTNVSFDDSKDLMKTTFHRSVPMVTYLACFIVCDFDHEETLTAHSKKFRVYARRDQMNFTQLALETGSKIQDDYEEYFDVPYPLPKQDMIAIPDFPSGAMEHWGLITYREVRLLYDPAHTSADDMQYLVKVVAHELTHQWFGNLVTMVWWDDLWLNEGFASFFAYYGLAKAKPEWQSEAAIIVEDMQKSFYLDNGDNSHPIVQTVNHPDEITSIFDAISYSKGASVIRMLEGFMGKKKFQKGIQTFLKTHSFGHAVTKDLWDAMTNESEGLNVSAIMDTWTLQMGFPVIHIERKGSNFTATQTRYLINPNSSTLTNDESKFNYRWEVPLSYRTKNELEPKIQWIQWHEEKIIFEISNLKEIEWVKFNADTTGYFRVNYEIPEWKRLRQLLIENHQNLSVSDRTGLLDDAFALAEADLLSYDIPLSMSHYLANETAYEPWVSAIRNIHKIGSLLQETADYGLFRKFYIQVLTPIYSRLGWTDSGTHAEKKLRRTILDLACSLQYQDCLQNAYDLLRKWIDDSKTVIPANLILIAFKYGMKSANPEIWEELWDRYLQEGSAQSRSNMLKGLASSSIPWLLNSLLDFSMDSNLIRSQDFPSVVTLVAKNPVGGSLAWNFLRNRWEELVKRFTINDRYLGNLISPVTSWFTTELQLNELENFIKKYPNGGAGTRPREQAKDKIKENIRWLHTFRIPVRDWLSNNRV